NRLKHGAVRWTKLAAQRGDAYVDVALASQEVGAPDAVEDDLAAEHLLGMPDEEPKQVELARGQVEEMAVELRLVARLVDGERPGDQHLEARLVDAAEIGADPRQQLLELERLDEVIVGSQVQALDTVLELVLGSQHEDGEVRAAAQ